MQAFCRMLDKGKNKRHCKIFPRESYGALCTEGQRGGGVRGIKSDAKRYTQGIDIYQHELIMLPIWIDKHWTSVAIDMVTKQIRYLDAVYEGGCGVILKINRWLRGRKITLLHELKKETKTRCTTEARTKRPREKLTTTLNG